MGKEGSEEETQAALVAEIPLGHAQATWDIGITAVYLASEAARCVNGDTIVSCSMNLHALIVPARSGRTSASRICHWMLPALS